MVSDRTLSEVLPFVTSASQTQHFSAWAALDTLLAARCAFPSARLRTPTALNLVTMVVTASSSRVSTTEMVTSEQLETTTLSIITAVLPRPISQLSGNPALSSRPTTTMHNHVFFLLFVLFCIQ